VFENAEFVHDNERRTPLLTVTSSRMAIIKEIKEDELYLWMNGKLIYKRWLLTGESRIFDVMAYDKYTLASITDLMYESRLPLVEVKARIRLKTAVEGGRNHGASSGYRPNHVFEYRSDGQLYTYTGDILTGDGNMILLGKEQIVTVRFLFELPIERYLNVGRKWWIHEGGKVIGEAEMIAIKSHT
jgi:hypothetical protein